MRKVTILARAVDPDQQEEIGFFYTLGQKRTYMELRWSTCFLLVFPYTVMTELSCEMLLTWDVYDYQGFRPFRNEGLGNTRWAIKTCRGGKWRWREFRMDSRGWRPSPVAVKTTATMEDVAHPTNLSIPFMKRGSKEKWRKCFRTLWKNWSLQSEGWTVTATEICCSNMLREKLLWGLSSW